MPKSSMATEAPVSRMSASTRSTVAMSSMAIDSVISSSRLLPLMPASASAAFSVSMKLGWRNCASEMFTAMRKSWCP